MRLLEMKSFVLAAMIASPAAAAPRWVDVPAWPAKAAAVDVTWLVSPIPPGATTPETTKAPLAVELRIGRVTRTIRLAPQLGALAPGNQAVCKTEAYPLGRHEVAKITFYEGGAGGYLVRRAGGVLSVVAWSLEDGACSDKHGAPGPCPQHEQVAVRLHAPDVPIHEHIVELDAAGARHAFACR
jgi:hypothetical protein